MIDDRPPQLQGVNQQVALPLPLVLTLRLDQSSFDRLNQLRQTYFPHHRNVLPAHVTLFHALPGEHEQSICNTLQDYSRNTAQFPLAFPMLRFLGRGFAAEIEAPELTRLHGQLAQNWWSWLTRQDRQTYKPHVTIQNKVSPETARSHYEQLAIDWKPLDGVGKGLLLWHYQGGPWELVEAFHFQADPAHVGTTPFDRR